MKQTNNAIKFLMAQYRAIFHNAYFKGLATAAVVTVAMAAGANTASAADAEVIFSGDAVTGEIVIDGQQHDSTKDPNLFTKIQITATPTADFSKNDIKITSGATTDNLISGSAAPVTFKANNLTIASTGDADQGLAITGTANSGANVTFTDVSITKGTLALTGDATSGEAILQAKSINLTAGDATGAKAGDAKITLASGSIVGYDLSGNGSDGKATVAGQANDIADYTEITLGKNGLISGTAAASDQGQINAAKLVINGGELNVSGGAAAGDNLIVNLVQGELNGGKITTAENSALTVKFASGDWNADKKLTLTAGTVDLSGGMTLEGAGTLTIAALSDDATKGVVVNGGADGSLTLQSGAALLTDAEQAKALAGKTKLTISGEGVLDFGAIKTSLNDLTFDATAATTGNKIGLDASGVIRGDDLTVTKNLGAEGQIEAKTLHLGDATDGTQGKGNDLTKAKFTVSKQLVVGKNVKVNSGKLTVDNLAQINADAKKLFPNDSNAQDAYIQAELLKQNGTLSSIDGVTNGKLTISGTSAALDVVAGNWTNNNVDLTLGDGSSQGTLNVGKADANNKDAKTAAALTFAQGSKLTIASGSVVVGDSGSNLLDATLDISALQATGDAPALTWTNGSFKVEDNGTIIANQSLITALQDSTNTNRKFTISSGGTLEIVDELEIDAEKIATSDKSNQLVFTGASGKLATLKSDTITINKAASGTAVNIGAQGQIIADELTLNNVNATTKKYEDVYLGSGNFVVKSNLNSDGSDLKATLTSSKLSLGQIYTRTDADGYDYHELASDTGSTNLDLVLADSGASVEVVGGNWALNDVTTSGKVYIGGQNAKYDINDDLITATVTGTKLTQKSGGTVDVAYGSNAQFTEFFTEAGAGATTIKGVMTVSGVANAAVTTDKDGKPLTSPIKANQGVSIANTVTIDGANAKLALGETALGALGTLKADGTGITAPTDMDPLVATGGKFEMKNFGTLELQFAEGTNFTLDELKSLRTGLTSNATADDDGFISLNGAAINGVTFDASGSEIKYEELNKFKDFSDFVIGGLKDATVTEVSAGEVVTGNVGNIKADANVSAVTIGQASLNKANANGQFAVDANGKQVDLSVTSGGYLHLNNDGEAKNIVLSEGLNHQDTVLLVKGLADGQTLINKVDAKGEKTEFQVASGNVKVTESVTVGNLNTLAGTSLETKNLTLNSDHAESLLSGKVTVTENAKFAGDVDVDGQTTIKGILTLASPGTNNDETFVAIREGGTLQVDTKVVGNANAVISVGMDDDRDAQGNVIEEGSNGYFFAKQVDLKGGILFVDPEYGKATSVAAIKHFGDKDNNKEDAGVLDGKVVIGKNAALMLGQDATIAQMQEYIERYQVNGSLEANNYGSILLVDDKLTLKKGSRIILDSVEYSNDIAKDVVEGKIPTADSKYAAVYSGGTTEVAADLFLGSNTLLAISDNILKQGAAIHFENTDAGILAEKNSKIVLEGSGFMTGGVNRSVTLFTDAGADNNGVKILGTNDILVETSNGLFSFTLKAGTEQSQGTLAINEAKVDHAFLDASDPVRYNLLQYATRVENLEDSVFYEGEGTAEPQVALVGDVADDGMVKYDATTGALVLTDKAIAYNNSVANNPDKIIKVEHYLSRIEGADEQGQGGERVIYHVAYNDFLEDVVMFSDGGPAEQAARLGAFGGAVQAALLATGTSYDAVAGRFGMGQQAGTLTVSSNGQGSGMWVTPVYKNYESDGFDADNITVGADVDLYGLALGGDFTMANGVRVGAMFNIGSGDADGTQESDVSNDFDYFGAALYAGYSINNFSVVGDITYTNIDSDVEANNELGKITSSFDTTALSVGVTGQYEMAVGGMQVTPHAGLRFTRIDMDDYRFVAADYEDGGEVAQSSINVFSIPVGVTIAKEYVSETWTVKPSFDLTITGNFGDDTIDSDLSWDGVATGAQVSSEFIDSFTYGATVGVAASNGNFGMGIGLNYTGSSNTDEFGVTANARFMF